jgi:hypothetical protein
VPRKEGVFAFEDAAGGGPVPMDRGLVGANGSSKIVSVWARRVFIVGRGESRHNSAGFEGVLRGSIPEDEWWRSSFLWSSRRLLNQFAQNWRTSLGLSRWIVLFRSFRRVAYSVGRPCWEGLDITAGGRRGVVRTAVVDGKYWGEER